MRFFLLLARVLIATTFVSDAVSAQEAIAVAELGARATAQSQGDALGITPSPTGASLRCGFQKLEGRVTEQGLWLVSTERGDASRRGGGRGVEEFRIVATGLGRGAGAMASLPSTGRLTASDKLVQLLRPTVVEEYSVSADGVRQDFVILQRPEGSGKLRLALTVDGARAEAAEMGAKLVLNGSNREIAYNRLRVTDARGRELAAKIEVIAETMLHIAVDDTGAEVVYPLRIDPTFSDADWVALNADQLGVNGYVTAIAGDETGHVYVGGSFTKAGTVEVQHIARWDGTRWWAVGDGLITPPTALAVMNGEVFAGSGGTWGGVRRWNGSTWEALNMQNMNVTALVVKDGDLYVGGSFSAVDGLAAANIAKWNAGSGWTALGAGVNGPVRALAANAAGVQLGGHFDSAGGVAALGVAQWNGTAWAALGDGFEGGVRCFAWHEGKLWAGNDTWQLGASYLAVWNGVSWDVEPEGGPSDPVISMASSGGELVIAMRAGVYSFPQLWLYDSTPPINQETWTHAGSPQGWEPGGAPRLASAGDEVIVGGDFSQLVATGKPRRPAWNVARWKDGNWRAMTRALDGPVQALIVQGNSIWVGGEFQSIGGQEAGGIAKWNGSAWETFNGGTNGEVMALWIEGNQVYAGGRFSTAGGVSAANVGRWNGAGWEALGSGFQGRVRTLVVSQGVVYAGGFLTAAQQPWEEIARWLPGQDWEQIMAGMRIGALAVFNGDVIAGGHFNYGVRRWDGSAWEPLGGGCNNEVGALLAHEGSLYVGGNFTQAGSVPAIGMARWDGSAWHALGEGMPTLPNGGQGGVWGLAAQGSRLFAVTGHLGSEKIPVYQWDGATWSALGTGLNYMRYTNFVALSPVRSLAVNTSGQLLVGGLFYEAGTLWSPFLVQANVPGSVLSARETWRQTHFGSYANEGEGADAADFDRDGVANLVEYAFALNPTQGSSAALPQPVVNGTDYVVSFAQPAGVSGVTYGAEWSTTLAPGSWQPITNTGTGAQHVFSVPVGANTRIFVRLKVTGGP